MSARLASCRLVIDDQPASGSWNMAVDEALLESGLAGDCIVRIYRWSQPTLSIGYFQNSEDPAVMAANLPIVRRLSGGGALVHDRELTYSCVLPPGQRLAQRPECLYEVVHSAIIKALADRGILLEFRGDAAGQSPGNAGEPFLCFLRQNSQDLVCHQQKVLGSAQRRRKGAWLQHGGLLLERSPHLPNCPGLQDLTSAPLPDGLAELLGAAISLSIAQRFTVGSLTSFERERAIAIEKLSSC